MYVKSLHLINYRNYDNIALSLGRNVNVFIGDNAQGKTNVLEAIYYSGFSKSHRTNKDRELIKWNADRAFISVDVGKTRLDKRIDINLFKDGKKSILVNSIKIHRIGELIGVFNVVMFSPEDLKIAKESPGVRRRFLDMEISQLNNKYYHSLVQYNKVMMQRNTVLKKIYNDDSILDIYDEQLSRYGEYIIVQRKKYIDQLNQYGREIHNEITSNKEDVSFKYMSSVKGDDDIYSNMLEMLKKNRDKDIDRRNTSVGPHRDDFNIYINDVDAKSYASQGQQRTVVLTIKFASLKIIKEVMGEYPVLLLDDVLSELDFTRKRYVLSSIGDIQTIITCTGIEDIYEYLDDKAKVFRVKDGKIIFN